MFLDEAKKVVMTRKGPEEKEQSGSDDTKKITFRCSYCGKDKPLDDMTELKRFFPPLIACRDCAAKI